MYNASYLAPMYADIVETRAVVVASPIYFYQVTGQIKLWVDRMFPMIDGIFEPRQPGKKAVTIFSQYQDDPTAFETGMIWFNDILKDFGWNLTASLACCGEPAEDSSEYKRMLKQAYAAGAALAKG
jgi:NADPH-dependent FMN reductase.